MMSKMNEEEWFKQEKALWERMWDDHNGDPTTYAMESAWMSQEYDNLTAEELHKENLDTVAWMVREEYKGDTEAFFKDWDYLGEYVEELKQPKENKSLKDLFTDDMLREIESADKNDVEKWKDTILDVVRRAIGLDTIKDGISYEILKPYFEDIANIGIGGFSKNSIAIELPGLKTDVCDYYLEIGVYAEEEGEYSPLTFEIDLSTENCMTKTGSDDNIDCIEVIDIPEKILQRYQDRQEAFELY